MPPLPDNARQAAICPTALENNPGSRSISDDDPCTWCSHLLYRPGELSLCSLSIPKGFWPCHRDENGYAQFCPTICFNNPSE
ncbi:TPA: hypothetical protein MDY78_005199 [Klebsiella pneumoniae]|nr:hypothetical protein [Klebsiella pneumoniae]